MFDSCKLRFLALAIVALGALLVLSYSFIPWGGFHYRLAPMHLLGGLLPFAVYAVLAMTLRHAALVVPGLFLITVQVLAWYTGYLFPDNGSPAQAAAQLAAFQTLVVLPVGLGIGYYIDRYIGHTDSFDPGY